MQFLLQQSELALVVWYKAEGNRDTGVEGIEAALHKVLKVLPLADLLQCTASSDCYLLIFSSIFISDFLYNCAFVL